MVVELAEAGSVHDNILSSV